MDTREKIVPLDSLRKLLATGSWAAVVGLFDPLTCIQATRLAEIAQNTGRKILAVVLEYQNALLAADARAFLMAGLRDVHAVVITATEDWRLAISPDSQVIVIEDIEAERARTAEFIEFIIARQSVVAG